MIKYRAHNLKLKPVELDEEYRFLNENHYQGYVNSRIAYGLYKDDELLEIMTFGIPRYNRNYGWELLRLCTKKDVVVHGGASKLFKCFTENSDISRGVISYCNRDKFDGNVYRALGFNSVRITKGYHYEKDGKSYHRQNFTKQNCLLKWPKYKDKTISERQIMQLEGFTRVEDKIGQELFVYNDPVKYFIYKLTFDDGSTYIGQHMQYKADDKYTTSSSYAKEHKIVNKEVLIEVKDKYTLNFIETLAIMQDKCNSPKNVNGNLGNFIFTHPFNISLRKNYKWTEETRAKMKAKQTGHLTSVETRRRISEALKGRKRTKEERKHYSESHQGIHWWTNGIESKHSRECPGEGWRRGRLNTMSEEAKKRLSELNKGKKQSEETKAKISKTLKGRKRTAEHVRKSAESRRGKKRTPEQIQKFKDAWIIRKQKKTYK